MQYGQFPEYKDKNNTGRKVKISFLTVTIVKNADYTEK